MNWKVLLMPTDVLNPEERKKRSLRLEKIGIREIPSTLPKLKFEGREVKIGRAEYSKHYYDVEVKNLEHLKFLIGNPDRSLETHKKSKYVPYPMHAHEVPEGWSDFSKLSPVEQVAVQRAAKNIVYGHSSALGLQESQYNSVLAWILKHGGTIPVFQAPDLEVMSGTTVTFSDAAVLSFNVVTVHGTGSIKLNNIAKVYVAEMHVVP